jgi:hypothetical protein
VVLHACNPSTGEAETRGSQVPGQPGVQGKILSQKNYRQKLEEQIFEKKRKCHFLKKIGAAVSPPHSRIPKHRANAK